MACVACLADVFWLIVAAVLLLKIRYFMPQSAEIKKKISVNFGYLRKYSEPNWSPFCDSKYFCHIFDDIRKENWPKMDC